MGPRARRQAPRLPHQAITALLAVLLLAAWSTPACAQQLTPFQGRGRPPTGGIDVYMSAVVDHLVEIDDANYRFEVGGGRGGGGGVLAQGVPVEPPFAEVSACQRLPWQPWAQTLSQERPAECPLARPGRKCSSHAREAAQGLGTGRPWLLCGWPITCPAGPVPFPRTPGGKPHAPRLVLGNKPHPPAA